MDATELLKSLANGIPDVLPDLPARDATVPHAPKRVLQFSQKDEKVRNPFP